MFETKFVEKSEAHILWSNFFSENLAVYEKTWKNILVPDKQQMTIWCMRIAC